MALDRRIHTQNLLAHFCFLRVDRGQCFRLWFGRLGLMWGLNFGHLRMCIILVCLNTVVVWIWLYHGARYVQCLVSGI